MIPTIAIDMLEDTDCTNDTTWVPSARSFRPGIRKHVYWAQQQQNPWNTPECWDQHSPTPRRCITAQQRLLQQSLPVAATPACPAAELAADCATPRQQWLWMQARRSAHADGRQAGAQPCLCLPHCWRERVGSKRTPAHDMLCTRRRARRRARKPLGHHHACCQTRGLRCQETAVRSSCLGLCASTA